ncbi:hypothetical protein CC86DRAFT_395691 [Ophiobolus disseminans]|uniref:DUF895 domain membrane protein n=1 Tax=Ophiobolus disseminans TaxID=1469910 RepID=A0A6A6ZTZ1_9PLEO|nr:hypothetical protein CC86DRAFT_395691 [Ophiobolus disseminans]
MGTHPFPSEIQHFIPTDSSTARKKRQMDIPLEQAAKPTPHETLKPTAETQYTTPSPTSRNPSLWPNFLPRYASPSVQVTLVDALNGLGGGGLVSAAPANNANVALYSTFTVVGFFAGIATNKLGGMVMLAYPEQEAKGKYIAWSWMIYNMGAVLGSTFNTFNLATFNIRTRSLNNLLYWLAETAGSYITRYALDSTCIRRALRARIAAGLLFVLVFIVWTSACVWQRHRPDAPSLNKDFSDADYVGPMLLYLSFGLFAAVWQTCLYWLLANFAGFYKGVQSAGGAVSFRINTLAVSSVNELVVCWVLLPGSLLIAASTIIRKVRDRAE